MEPSVREGNSISNTLDQGGHLSTMVPRVLPKEEEEGNSPPLHTIRPAVTRKRRCVSSACIPCRKRKSKCDGVSPACSTCTAVYRTECVYDYEGDHRRKGALKRDLAELSKVHQDLDTIVKTIRSASESDVGDLVNHLREHGNLADIVAGMPDGPVALSLETDLGDMLDKFRVGGGGELRSLGYGTILGDENPNHRELNSQNSTRLWTHVTADVNLISDLLSLYFTWNHPSYVLFSKSCFLADMKKGRRKYCSPLLVNAILALACHFSNRPEARADPNNPSSAGDHFFEEAKQILASEGETPSLTSVQALALMSLHEAGCGRDSSGWMYSGRAFRMGLDLGFNLPLDRLSPLDRLGLSPTEIEVRKITFWGCFTIDKMWSSFLGRIPQLPSAIVGVQKPGILGPLEREIWEPYGNPVRNPPGFAQPGRVQTIATRFCEVSENLGDILSMFFSPKERVTSIKLKTLCSRLKKWYAGLPADMSAKNEALPSVLGLHIYYHATLLLLLRPFFCIEISITGQTPREICRRAANDIVVLTTQYQRAYTLRHTVIHIPQILLAATTILLMDLPSPAPSNAISPSLLSSLKDLQELSETWHWCNLTLRHIGIEAEKRNIDLGVGWEAISSAHMIPRPLGVHNRNNTNVNHGFPPLQYCFGTSNSENQAEVTGHGAQQGNPGWSTVDDDDDVQGFVNSLVSFPGTIEEWGCIGANS